MFSCFLGFGYYKMDFSHHTVFTPPAPASVNLETEKIAFSTWFQCLPSRRDPASKHQARFKNHSVRYEK